MRLATNCLEVLNTSVPVALRTQSPSPTTLCSFPRFPGRPGPTGGGRPGRQQSVGLSFGTWDILSRETGSGRTSALDSEGTCDLRRLVYSLSW